MKREKLSAEEIDSKLQDLNDWSRRIDPRPMNAWSWQDEKLIKRFKFDNFADSLMFVNKIGEIAETADHHPDIKFGWGYAEIETTTHDRSGVTDFDFDLATKIEEIDR